MAFVHGSTSSVWFRSVSYSPVLNSWTFEGSVGNHDTTTLEDTWKKNQAGTNEATFSAEGFYDTSYDDALFNMVGAQVVNIITLCPGGSAIGAVALMMQAYSTAFGLSANPDDMWVISMASVVDAGVEFGRVLHAFTEDTNTTTGASQDGGAATSTGWTAFIHCSLVDGGSWVVKLQDSADNSSWADVTGGSFTAITTSSTERLQSATATTALRRYVRYVATRTGGSAGDGITFGLSYARTKTS